MKKLFLSLVAAIVAATATYAQNSLIAVLTHEGNVQAFYGADALRDAHTAAVNGDIITLSSGTFNSTDITKGITIRGAGMKMDEENKIAPTIITGSFYIKGTSSSYLQNFLMEGVRCENQITSYYIQKPTFIKCWLYSITDGSSYYFKNGTFLHCYTKEKAQLTSSQSTATFVNSIINNPTCYNKSTCRLEFINCLLHISPASLYYSSLTNCIMNNSDSSVFPAATSVLYCVGENKPDGVNMFQNINNSTNYSVEDEGVLWKPDTYFELTDEAKEAYKGQDGTEVGIYGGNMPYDPMTTNPKITKYMVAGKSTAEGKLSVDIEVKAAE